MKKSPDYIVYCGPMWSGKTSALLSYIDKCKFQNKRVAVFKPRIDTRYSEGEIVSHAGWKVTAHCVEDGDGIVEFLANSEEVFDVIAVDELFMLKGAADILAWAFRSGVTIVASTLDLSSTCTAFPEVKKALAWATKVVKCTAVCAVCGADARYTYRLRGFDGMGEISVGGDDQYEARCFLHHPHVGEKAAEPGTE